MNTLNPTKNPYLTGTENRTSTNNNRNGVIAKLFGRKANNPLTQSSNTKSDNKSLNTTTTGSRADAANSRVDIFLVEAVQMFKNKAKLTPEKQTRILLRTLKFKATLKKVDVAVVEAAQVVVDVVVLRN